MIFVRMNLTQYYTLLLHCKISLELNSRHVRLSMLKLDKFDFICVNWMLNSIPNIPNYNWLMCASLEQFN